MSKIILIVIVIAVVAGGIYFFSPGQTNDISNGNVTIVNFAFSQDVLNISKGDTVVWTNQDSAPHNISGNGFASSILNKGQSFSFTFDEVGSYDYICSLHPYMKGKIMVK